MNSWGVAAATALSQWTGAEGGIEPLFKAARRMGVEVEWGDLPYGRLVQAGGEWVILLGRRLQGWLLELAFAHELGHFLRGSGLADYQRRHADSLALKRLAELNRAREEADARSFAAAWLAREKRFLAEHLYRLQSAEVCQPVSLEPEGRVYGRLRAEIEEIPAISVPWLLARTVW